MRTGKLMTSMLMVAGLGLAGTVPIESGAQAEPQLAFDSLFSRGAILEDRNGDGIVDFVNARIVVPESASPSDISGAAEIAARFGYETTATNIPLVVADSRIEPASARHPLILIGQNIQWVSSLLNAKKVEPAKLTAGQGEAILFPSPFGSSDALAIFGADEVGTLAAARAVASRTPFVGNIGGARFATVESDVEQFLSEKKIQTASPPRSIRMVTDASPTTVSVSVEVRLSSQQQLRAAQRALQSLATAHRQGRSGEVLSYPGLASLEVELSAEGRKRSVIIPGAAAPETAVAAPPGEAGTKQFDLSNLYSIEGLFEDTNKDLIPDASTTALILGQGSARPAVGWLATRLGLESAGIRLPLTQKVSKLEEVPKEGHPVLIGTEGDLIAPLREQGKLRGGDLGAGEGLVQVVPEAVGDSVAVVVTGGDEAGLDAALDYVSQRLPHLETSEARIDPAWGICSSSGYEAYHTRFDSPPSGPQASVAPISGALEPP